MIIMIRERLTSWLKDNTNNIIRISIIIFFLLLAIWAITLERYSLVLGYDEASRWLTIALVSVGPELAGIVVGVVTIDYLNERRQDDKLKKQLVLQMGSGNNDVSDAAVRTLRAYGWLKDGSLKKSDLWGANLNGADLFGANLGRVYLSRANLHGADLRQANLSFADLREADLSEAILVLTDLSEANLRRSKLRNAVLFGTYLLKTNISETDMTGITLSSANLSDAILQDANLREADLSEANLRHANLCGANLYGANLREADLHQAKNWTLSQLLQAKTLEGATMPDGRPYEEWIQDPEHQLVDEEAVAEIDSALATKQQTEEE